MDKEKLNLVYISLGSNLGDKKDNLDKAINMLHLRIGKVTKQSTYITTKPEDMQNAGDFLNACVEIYTIFNPEELLNQLKKIEFEFGRDPSSKGKYESRIIDLDIIFFNQLIYESNKLKIPHPKYHLREFVLIPLREINCIFLANVIE
ncbi:MAG: 2-amino-4-hydroxy-6-hydroxymethyldihydropteridine diphosphokinase [Bacteroidetes bacterium]|nr:2-amino-4-hydroxy-6-hydroxymethyldihydropteridine diphosphokinase [Bacteroidota bacterium]